MVTIGTSYDKVEPPGNVQSWSKGAQQNASVVQSEVLNSYNMSIGGVDKHNSLTSMYATSIRCKKWY